jgi:hypothetical protein
VLLLDAKQAKIRLPIWIHSTPHLTSYLCHRLFESLVSAAQICIGFVHLHGNQLRMKGEQQKYLYRYMLADVFQNPPDQAVNQQVNPTEWTTTVRKPTSPLVRDDRISTSRFFRSAKGSISLSRTHGVGSKFNHLLNGRKSWYIPLSRFRPPRVPVCQAPGNKDDKSLRSKVKAEGAPIARASGQHLTD